MGGFRFRKSIKLGPGVRMNVGKKSLGVSVGTRGARYSVSTAGRRTASVGAPGTGVGYTSSRGGGRKRSSARQAAPALAAPPKPGLFAPKHEKEFHKALQTYAKGDIEQARNRFRKSSEADTGGRVLADDLLAGILGVQAGKSDEAIPHLETVVSSEVPLPDALMTKYGVAGSVKLDVTERVQVEVDFGSLAAALALPRAGPARRSHRRPSAACRCRR